MTNIRPTSASTSTVKLQKALAQAGLGSRREMEQWISAGRVTVNGVKARLGARVGASDEVKVDGRLVRAAVSSRLPRVLLYHKPEGEIVSRDDPAGRPSVFDKLPQLRGAKWLAVGRLDFNSCGLLVFTTSGELANRMMHPSHELEREYAVRVLGTLTEGQTARLLSGIQLDDGVARCDSVVPEGGEGANRWYRLVLKEGRNRIVRRLFEALGLRVSRLMRIRFGPLALPPRLRRGQVLELGSAETRQLLTALGMPAPAPPRGGARGSAGTHRRHRAYRAR
ncbi:MAG: pseudouridine synthase [Betaproteobacteria bacterium]|nr:pseudouridine synthase [Betaproteobacteria bacterium]